MEEEMTKMNMIVDNLKERKERQEQYYFGTTTEKNHMVWIEAGSTDHEDKEKFALHHGKSPSRANELSSDCGTVTSTSSNDLNLEQQMTN